MADKGMAQNLTLEDPLLLGVYRHDGVYLPDTQNDWRPFYGDTPLQTIEFSKSGTYYLVVSHDRYLDGGTFEISLYDMGGTNQHWTEIDADNLTYEPGHFDGT